MEQRSAEQYHFPAVNSVLSASYSSLPSVKQADYLRQDDYSYALSHFSSNFPAKGPLVFPARTTQKPPKDYKKPYFGVFLKSLHLNSMQVAQHFVTSMHPGGFINSADGKQEAQDGLFSFFPLFK